MGNKYTSDYLIKHTDRLDRVSLPAVDTTIEGGGVVWVIDEHPLQGAVVYTVRDYDQSRHGEYDGKHKPCIIIKCAVDCQVLNKTIKNADGDTLYTFSTDCSTIPQYLVLRLTTTRAWELA